MSLTLSDLQRITTFSSNDDLVYVVIDVDTVPKSRAMTKANLESEIGGGGGLQAVQDDPAPTLGGNLNPNDFDIFGNGGMDITSPITRTDPMVEFRNFAQQGSPTAPFGLVYHHYTDGDMIRLDNVGGGAILQMVNARNPTLRPDQPNDYVGDGNFFELITQSSTGGPAVIEWFVAPDGSINYPSTGAKTHKVTIGRAADSEYAVEFQFTNDHVNMMNVDNKYRVQYDSGNSRVNVVAFEDLAFFANDTERVFQATALRVDFYKPLFFQTVGNTVVAPGNFNFQDNARLRLGTGNDIQIYFDGTNTEVELYGGDVIINENTTERFRFERTTGKFNSQDMAVTNLGVFADDAAAGVGGLVQGDFYQTATGELRVKL